MTRDKGQNNCSEELIFFLITLREFITKIKKRKNIYKGHIKLIQLSNYKYYLWEQFYELAKIYTTKDGLIHSFAAWALISLKFSLLIRY